MYFCLACKFRLDVQNSLGPELEERREVVALQLGYALGKVVPGIPAITVLVIIDCQTRMLSAFPVGPKDPNFRGQAEHVTRFFLHVEPRGQAGNCGRLRTNNAGFVSKDSFDETALWLPDSHHTHGNPGSKGRTGQVERAIQTCRWQASAIQAMAGEKCEIELPEDQALVPWTYILFELHSCCWAIESIPCSLDNSDQPWLVFGRSYSGRAVCFGEVVLLLHQRGVNCKHGPQWVPGVWLGKTEVDDQHAIASPDGILRGKAIKRISNPWRGVWFFLVLSRRILSSLLEDEFCSRVTTPKPVTEVHSGPGDQPVMIE